MHVYTLAHNDIKFEYSEINAGNVNTNNTNVNANNNKWNGNYVRPCNSSIKYKYTYMEEDLIKLEDVFESYYECRKNKRNTLNSINYEINYESNNIKLWEDLNSETYEIGRSIAFVTKYPTVREVFAADFRDRIVHHPLIRYFKDDFYREFIDNSFSCTEGKGVLSGVLKLSSIIYEKSEGYSKDCYIFKSDVKSFFMSINKDILFRMIIILVSTSNNINLSLKGKIIRLFSKVIYNRPELNCIIKGNPNDWSLLKNGKSLFHLDGSKGLPIGNLTSQYFANLYMTKFDKYVINTLGFDGYCRYVDDFVIVSSSKEEILDNLNLMRNFLNTELNLVLHPNKLYLQHYTKGVKFIGSYIKPGYILTGNRSIHNFIRKLEIYNSNEFVDLKEVRDTINSYLGLMRHFNSYTSRCKIINCDLMNKLSRYLSIDKNLLCSKIISKNNIVKLN